VGGLGAWRGTRPREKAPSPGSARAIKAAILGYVEKIRHEALAIGRILTGQDSRLVGPIRLTAAETLMAEVLAPRVDDPSQLRRRRLARSMMRPERG